MKPEQYTSVAFTGGTSRDSEICNLSAALGMAGLEFASKRPRTPMPTDAGTGGGAGGAGGATTAAGAAGVGGGVCAGAGDGAGSVGAGGVASVIFVTGRMRILSLG